VHLRAQVGDHCGRRVAQVVEDLDQAALLGHDDTAVGREAHGGRRGEPAERDRLGEPGWDRGGLHELGGGGGQPRRVERTAALDGVGGGDEEQREEGSEDNRSP
jgi:hypothetical protein